MTARESTTAYIEFEPGLVRTFVYYDYIDLLAFLTSVRTNNTRARVTSVVEPAYRRRG